MVYELIRKSNQNGLRRNEISLTISKIMFSQEIVEDFEKTLPHFQYLLVYLDKENKKMAFNPTKDEKIGYKLSSIRGRMKVMCFNVDKFIGNYGRFMASKNSDGLWEIDYSKKEIKITSDRKKIDNRANDRTDGKANGSGRKLSENEIAVGKTTILFNKVSSLQITGGRMEIVVQKQDKNKDLVLFRQTKNVIDGIKVQRTDSGSVYLPITNRATKKYAIGRYSITKTPDGFLAELKIADNQNG